MTINFENWSPEMKKKAVERFQRVSYYLVAKKLVEEELAKELSENTVSIEDFNKSRRNRGLSEVSFAQLEAIHLCSRNNNDQSI